MQKYKQVAVEKISRRLKDSKSIVLVDYKGINIQQVDDLRARFRDAEVDYFVSKNTFIKRALNDMNIEQLDDYLVGPTAVAVSKLDEIEPTRVISKFKKEVLSDETFPSFKVGYIDNTFMNSKQLEQVAKMPSKNELLAKMMASMSAPITNFVFINKAIMRKFVYVLNAIKDSKNK